MWLAQRHLVDKWHRQNLKPVHLTQSAAFLIHMLTLWHVRDIKVSFQFRGWWEAEIQQILPQISFSSANRSKLFRQEELWTNLSTVIHGMVRNVTRVMLVVWGAGESIVGEVPGHGAFDLEAHM